MLLEVEWYLYVLHGMDRLGAETSRCKNIPSFRMGAKCSSMVSGMLYVLGCAKTEVHKDHSRGST